MTGAEKMQSERQLVSFLFHHGTHGHSPRSASELIDLIQKGFSLKAVMSVKEAIHLTDRELATLLGMSERTLSRMRRTASRLSPVASDRLYRVVRIFALAKEVLEGEGKAADWLHRPLIGLGGRKPLEMIQTEAGAREVEDLLGRIEHGVIS
jgi:putative toxin-antitoxin system antitoxin component (TIGR02293 family)